MALCLEDIGVNFPRPFYHSPYARAGTGPNHQLIKEGARQGFVWVVFSPAGGAFPEHVVTGELYGNPSSTSPLLPTC